MPKQLFTRYARHFYVKDGESIKAEPNKKNGRYKVRKEPSPAKRCEKSGKDAKRAVLWKKNVIHVIYKYKNK